MQYLAVTSRACSLFYAQSFKWQSDSGSGKIPGLTAHLGHELIVVTVHTIERMDIGRYLCVRLPKSAVRNR